MYRAAIIGAGGIAGMGILGLHDEENIGRKKFRASHAGGYEAHQSVDLVAVADIDPEKLETFGTAWEIPETHRYTDYETMLDDVELDVVSVCTPSMFHHDPVVTAAESGNPDLIWCEKPIASSVAEGETMVNVCDDNDVELVINHSFRFTSQLQRLRDLLVKDDLIGDIRSVSANFRMELMRNATHVLDTLVYLLDARAERVAGYITGENEAVDALQADRRVDDAGGGGFVVLDDGTLATVDCTVPRSMSSMSYQLFGQDGKLYLNNDDGEWRYWALQDGSHVEQPLPGMTGTWSWDEDYTEAFPNAVEHIVEILDGEAENRSTGEEAIRSLEIIVAFYISDYTGSQVEIPMKEPLRDVSITSW